MNDVDLQHLTLAIELADQGRGVARPNPLVGAVLARGEQVLAEGFHARYGERHAERVALDAWPGEVPSDATLYVSLEPCAHHGRQPPCAQLLLERGVRRVVIAAADPTGKTAGQGPQLLHRAGVRVEWGPRSLAERALRQNAGFHTVARLGRPFVTSKLAMTRDGFLALPGDRWVSGEESRELVHAMRAASGAGCAGIGTVLADDPLLTVRGSAAQTVATQPLRVVYDRSLRLPLDSQLVRTAQQAPVLAMCSGDAPHAAERELAEAGVEVLRAAGGLDGAELLDWSLRELARRGVCDVLLEAGPRLTSAFADADLVDRAAWFVAPVEAASLGETSALPHIDPSSDLAQLALGPTAVVQRVGDDELRTVWLLDPARWAS